MTLIGLIQLNGGIKDIATANQRECKAIFLYSNKRFRQAILVFVLIAIPSFAITGSYIVSDSPTPIDGVEENPYPYFKQADLFILSSRFEGMPNVVLEALALNTQVVATPSPGGVTALLSKSNACTLAQDISACGLLSALESYFSNKSIQTIEPEVIEPYKVESVTKQYEKVLLDISK